MEVRSPGESSPKLGGKRRRHVAGLRDRLKLRHCAGLGEDSELTLKTPRGDHAELLYRVRGRFSGEEVLRDVSSEEPP